MIKLYLKSKKKSYEAIATFNPDTKEIIVLKGSKISETISGGTFKSAKSVEQLRNSGCIENRLLVQNLSFKSVSSAANFVTGSSTNGMLAWKDKDGKKLKDIFVEKRSPI